MRPLRIVLTFVALVLAPGLARAGELTITVNDAAGKPVPNAVVSLYPAAGLPSGPIRFPWPYVVAQQNIQFDPYVLVAPVGAEVSFPNLDKVRHHVYSFSAGNRFTLKLYGREEHRTVKMQAVGVAALGCNIHDRMSAYIRVVDTPFAAKTDASGVAVLHDVPAGGANLRLWHPDMRGTTGEVAKTVSAATVAKGRDTETMDVHVRPAPTPLIN